MIYKNLPEKFNTKFEVVSCFLECQGEILLLQRHGEKSQGGKWGVPAGKIDLGEDEKTAVLRELREETGLAISENQVNHRQKLYVRYPEYDFVFDIFLAKLDNRPEVVLNSEEHTGFKWLSPKDALALDLILDEDECIKMTYNI